MPQKRKVDRHPAPGRRAVVAENLESRQLLSAITDPLAHPVDDVNPAIAPGSTSPPGFSPAQIDQA